MLIVTQLNGVPILVKNIATVVETEKPRLGDVKRDAEEDAVEGIIVMRKGENAAEVLDGIHKKVADLNENVLPKDVKIVPYYDRTTLMDFATHTVLHNLFEGIILVTLIVLIFMADWRTTLIVGIIVPLSLLFAFTCMRIKGMTANLYRWGR